MTWQINEPAIPDLAFGLSRGLDAIGDSIAFCRGGWKAVKDKSFPTHAFIFLRMNGRLVAFEEGPQGLRPQPLAEYAEDKNRIVAVYYCHCWDDPDKAIAAKDMLMKIWLSGGPRDRYGWATLFHFLPWIGPKIQPSKQGEICSEDVAGVAIDAGGVQWLKTKIVAPDQLGVALHAREQYYDVDCVLHYQDEV